MRACVSCFLVWLISELLSSDYHTVRIAGSLVKSITQSKMTILILKENTHCSELSNGPSKDLHLQVKFSYYDLRHYIVEF